MLDLKFFPHQVTLVNGVIVREWLKFTLSITSLQVKLKSTKTVQISPTHLCKNKVALVDVGRVMSRFKVLELQSLCIPNAIKHTVEVMQLVSATVRRA